MDTYEKKYKEALTKAREIKSKILSSHLSTESCKAVSEYIDEIIPELAESEDERVIKALETFINQPEIADKITFEARIEWLSWLEKQKEQKPNIEICPHSIKGKSYLENPITPEMMSKAADECIWGQCGDNRFWIIDRAKKDILAKTNIECSPEEMKVLGSFLFRCWQMGWLGKYDVIVPEQKPVEWSEEDENKLNHILEIVHIASGSEASVDEKEELESFLKSLRPQWKPSEEQMEALRNAVNKLANTDVADSVRLSIMYDNLKKL